MRIYYFKLKLYGFYCIHLQVDKSPQQVQEEAIPDEPNVMIKLVYGLDSPTKTQVLHEEGQVYARFIDVMSDDVNYFSIQFLYKTDMC